MSSFICYKPKRFNERDTALITVANTIIEEYIADGYVLTLRQLYYQFVARDIVPNNMQMYNLLQRVFNHARLAGLMDWEAIEDRTREMRQRPFWEDAKELVGVCSRQFHIDMWENQPTYVEVWIEKDALTGVIAGVCNKYGVPYLSCRGYNSQSEQWRAGQRIKDRVIENNQQVVILHLGDHDPSGIHMTDDNRDRLEMFCEVGGNDFQFERIALNMDQVREHKPPSNPAKMTDTRVGNYLREYGSKSWELDALNPNILAGLVEDHILELRDDIVWSEDYERDQEHRALLKQAHEEWDDVVDFLKENR